MIKKHIPKIRFQGFDDEWEEIIIGKNFRVTRGLVLSTSKVSKVFTEDYCFPVYSSQTKNNGLLGFYLDFLFDSAITWTTDGANAGTVKYREGKFYSTNVNGVLLSDKLVANQYIAESLNRIAWKYVSKVGNPKLMNNVMSEIPITISLSLPEQESIGQIFRTLDDLISAYKENLEHYQSLKTSMLSKMFPKEGQKQPEIRLDGFEGDWEVRQIKEFSEVVRGASPRPIQNPKWFDSNSDIGWLRISDVTKQEGKIYYLEQKLSREGQLKTRVLTTPHLLLSIAASVGKPVINYVKTGVHDGFLIFLNPKFNIDFMFFWLEMFKDGWNKYGQPGSQVNLNKDIVRNHYLHLPSLPEQEAIGAFFANLDETISSYKDKVGQLELLKKNLLSQMFI